MTDESHSVVKQALVSIESLIPLLLVHLPASMQTDAKHLSARRPNLIRSYCQQTMNTSSEENSTDDPSSVKTNSKRFEFDQITIAVIIDRLQLVFANIKYWVVQCKYSELIACLNYDAIEWHVGEDERQVIQVRAQYNLLEMFVAKITPKIWRAQKCTKHRTGL